MDEGDPRYLCWRFAEDPRALDQGNRIFHF